jgi:hypothetical protein
MAVNCWEFRDCGRGSGGRLTPREGLCPAAVCKAADGYLGGISGGRACCFIKGTVCEENGQQIATYRGKSESCWDCEFYRMLRREHGPAFSMPAFALHLERRDKAAFRAFIEENRREPVGES